MAGVILRVGLMLAISARATQAFRGDLESGLLELVLCTPARPGGILSAKAQALIREFGPAFLVFLLGDALRWGEIFLGQFGGDLVARFTRGAMELSPQLCLVAAMGLNVSLLRVDGKWLIAFLAGWLIPWIAVWMRDLAEIPLSYSLFGAGGASILHALRAHEWVAGWLLQGGVILFLLRRTYCILARRRLLWI